MPKVIFNIAFTSKIPPKKLSPEKKAKYLARRSFYNLTADYNYLAYTLNGNKVVKNKDMLEYMLNPDKHQDEATTDNTGAFNLSGPLSKEQLEDIKQKIRTTDSHIWHGVISFDDETSLGFTTQEKAMHFLKHSFSAFIERSHLKKSNLEIIASLHDDTDNKHIHFSFFEKEPLHRNCRGELGYTAKGTVANRVLENYLVSANMHLSDHSYDYYSARDRAMARLKALRAQAVESKFSKQELRLAVLDLAKKLPKDRRMQYNSAGMERHRKDIDEVVNIFVRSDPESHKLDKEFRAALAAKESEAYDMVHSPVDKQLRYVNNRELHSKEVKKLLAEGKTEYIRANKISWENIDYFEQLRQDYKARQGNQILGLIKDMNRSFDGTSMTAGFNDKTKKIAARKKRRHSNGVLHSFMRTLGEYQNGVTADFTERLHRVEREMAQQISGSESY